jgi:phosphinothricin acetyltransferase
MISEEHLMSDSQPVLRSATRDDLFAINSIYNYEIEFGIATWDDDPWTIESRESWFDARSPEEPVLVVDLDGHVAGFGYLSWYRSKIGYRFTREDTLYLVPTYQRRGIGARLLEALIEQAKSIGIHTLIAQIESSNEASIALHQNFGFELLGLERQVGYKFDRWLDAQSMQLLLPTGGLTED